MYAKLVTLCTLSLILAGGAAAQGYTFMWWADGFRGHSAEGRRTVNVQTDRYGASFDVERTTLTRLGPIDLAATYGKAAAQTNAAVERLDAAALHLTATVRDKTFTCTRAARKVRDHMHYPVRLIDSGRWLSRFDISGLEFTDAHGEKLDAECRLEVAAWPERMRLTLELSPRPGLDDVTLSMELVSKDNRIQEVLHFGAADPSMRVHLVWPPEDVPLEAARVRVTDATPEAATLPVHVEEQTGACVVGLPARQWDLATDLDRLDRFPLALANDSGNPVTLPLMFVFEGSFQGVTGLCPMLLDEAGNPTGTPVQLSKNWHRQQDERILYEGAWLHAITEVVVPPGGWRGQLAITYARWGGVPAASHAQLCLIGYGGNQRWDQAAIGSFGESICYDPDVGLNRSVIDDVRPLMVRSMNDGKWEWTHNVGGGDFLVYYNPAGEKQYFSGVKTAYLSQGPNLTDVIYAGQSADGKIAARIEVRTPRCDDVNRAYHQVRYDVREVTPFTRLAFYQLGADAYNDHQFTTIARGNNEGLVEEAPTERGGQRYLRGPMACEGGAPWVALLGGIRSPQLDKGAWADRAIVVREWKARLGGRDVPVPFAAIYGTENGIPSANVELVPPPGVTQLEPGDFVEAEIELLVLPQHAEDYYGPNNALRASLETDGGTWRGVQRLAKGNDLAVEVCEGTLTRRLPIEVAVNEKDAARFRVTGGVGYVPITFTGLESASGFVLEADGTPVNQGVHGNDFWQITPDAVGKTFSRTYNVCLDGEPRTREFSFHPAAASK